MSITNNIIHNTQMSTFRSSSKLISSKGVCFLMIDKENNHPENPFWMKFSLRGGFERPAVYHKEHTP